MAGTPHAPGDSLSTESNPIGLNEAEVARLRGQFGFNDIVAPARSAWRMVLRDTVRDPMLWFLLFTASLFAVLGDTTESLTLLVALLPLLGMDAYLHRRTAASSAGLASRLANTTRVLRDGQWRALPARELVPGDWVEVSPGDYFPADGWLVSGEALQVDESTLTGESLPVAKQAQSPAVPLAERPTDRHWASAGTRLLTGTARLRVAATGADTRYGEIVRSATEGSHSATPLQQAIQQLVGVLLGFALLVCALLAGVRWSQGHGWMDALLSAVTLAVAAVPEEFPVVYTFFLGMGVFRLARRQALVRRAVAVENIGRTTCIVSDKTGTITAGTLQLAQAVPVAGQAEAWVREVAARAARADSGDPMDEALRRAAGPLRDAIQVGIHPFTEARRRETALVAHPQGGVMAFTKGAPETILDVCNATPAQRAQALATVTEHAQLGRKLIACAWQHLSSKADPQVEPDSGFSLAGWLAFEDPVREGVQAAIADCLAAGMRVLMVTGDHPATATAIARAIGLGGSSPVTVVLETDDDPERLLRAHPDVHVVARAKPAQKLALVRALQAQGEVVAVTGDGVNDVPALRQADIGVAMGERGTRSAREVAPVVLLDDNFRTIVQAVAEGRQLFQNLRVAFAYLLLVHVPLVVGAAAIPLLGLPLLLLPIHIVWLELIIHPTALLAFQSLVPSGPLAPVRHRREARFFSFPMWLGLGAVGLLASAAVVGSYLLALGLDHNVAHARAMALAVLMAVSAGFTLGLSRLHTAAARVMVLVTALPLLVVVQWPPLSRLFSLQALHTSDWAGVGLAGVWASVAGWTVSSRLLSRVPGKPTP